MHDLQKKPTTAVEMIEPINLMSQQQLGEPDPTLISKHDLLSAIAFDKKGEILSVGDRGGRIICFQLTDFEKSGQNEFDYLTEFQAMTKSFDVLQSQDISETVTAMEWLNSSKTQQPAMLASNSRQTKLFKIVNKQVKKCESVKKKLAKGKGLSFPKTKIVSESKEGKHFETYKTGNESHIHSLSMSPDQESFLVADDNLINLWNIEQKDREVYNLIDYNRRKAAEDQERVMSATFSSQSTMFLYTTNKGDIRVCDFREASNFQHRPSV